MLFQASLCSTLYSEERFRIIKKASPCAFRHALLHLYTGMFRANLEPFLVGQCHRESSWSLPNKLSEFDYTWRHNSSRSSTIQTYLNCSVPQHALSQGGSLILDTFLLFSSVLDGFGVLVLCRLWFDKHSLLGATKTFARHSVALPLWHQATATVAHLLNCGAKRKLRCWVRPWQCDTQHAHAEGPQGKKICAMTAIRKANKAMSKHCSNDCSMVQLIPVPAHSKPCLILRNLLKVCDFLQSSYLLLFAARNMIAIIFAHCFSGCTSGSAGWQLGLCTSAAGLGANAQLAEETTLSAVWQDNVIC